MEVSIIVAKGKNGEIGANNKLLWNLPSDLKFFKEMTTGKSIIMGRKTFESLPHALPNRQNIVISNNKDFVADGATVVDGFYTAIMIAHSNEIFAIGGRSIYKWFLGCADKIYCTEIDKEYPEADTFFPEININDWDVIELGSGEENGVKYRRNLYRRRW